MIPLAKIEITVLANKEGVVKAEYECHLPTGFVKDHTKMEVDDLSAMANTQAFGCMAANLHQSFGMNRDTLMHIVDQSMTGGTIDAKAIEGN